MDSKDRKEWGNMKILKRNQIIVSVLALMLITVGYMNYTSNMTDAIETGSFTNGETMAGIGDAKLVNSNSTTESDGVNMANNSDVVQNSEGNMSEDNSNGGENKTNTVATAESDVNSENEGKSNNTSASSTSSNNSNNTSASGTSSNSGNNTSASSTSSNNGNNTPVDNNSNNNENNISNKNNITNSITTNSSTKATSIMNSNTDYFITSRLERDKMYSQILETYQGLLESNTVSTEQNGISSQEIANINAKKNSIMIAENLIKNLGIEDVVIFVNDKSTSVIVKADKLEDADVAQIQNIVCREIGVSVEEIHISLKS